LPPLREAIVPIEERQKGIVNVITFSDRRARLFQSPSCVKVLFTEAIWQTKMKHGGTEKYMLIEKYTNDCYCQYYLRRLIMIANT
jgi:hypothetical protein